MIARPTRRTGPIPFAPFPPLGERPQVAAHRDPREPRTRSRWLPAQQAEHQSLSRVQPQQLLHHASRNIAHQTPHSAQFADAKFTGAEAPSTPAMHPTPPRSTPGRGCHATYHGQGTLSVLSSVTGHHYRFEGRGCTLSIDPRDRLVLGRLNELSIHSASV